MIRFEIDQFETWRSVARQLLHNRVPPQAVNWGERTDGQLHLPLITGEAEATPPADGEELDPDSASAEAAPMHVPKTFIVLAQTVACHRDPAKWSRLYHLLWRMTRGERNLLDRVGDEDVHRLLEMEKDVRRDSQRMKAFIRFHPLGTPPEQVLVAWYRPDHLILRRVAPFFVRKYPRRPWAILTPDGSVFWDRQELQYGPGVDAAGQPRRDELERLWQVYRAAFCTEVPPEERTEELREPVRGRGVLPEGAILDALLTDAHQQLHEPMRQPRKPETSAADFLPVRRDLATLARAARSCQGCPLHQRATQTVFGEGLPDADIVFVGDQPGDAEDRQGHPFVGRAGRLLEEAIQQAGIDRTRVYLTNAVKHFKWEGPARRRMPKKPDQREQAACRPWLEAELAALRPKVVVCLGATAAQVLLGRDFRITRQRGEVFPTDWAPCTIATHHPSAILRLEDGPARDQMRQEFLADIQRAATQLHELHPAIC